MSDNDSQVPVTELDPWGPVDYLVAVVPAGADAGAGLSELLGLVATGQVRLLDLEVFAAAPDGVVEVAETGWESVLGAAAGELAGVRSGLLDADDRAQLSAVVGEGEHAVVVVYESLVTRGVVAAWERSGVTVVDAGPLGASEIDAALTATEEIA